MKKIKGMNVEKISLIVVMVLITIMVFGEIVHADLIRPDTATPDDTTKINQTKTNSSFYTYTVRRGETVSEIAWVLGILMKDLVVLNPEIMEEGIRDLQPGMKLKYRLPEDMAKVVDGGTKKTIQAIKLGSGAISTKIKKLERKMEDENKKMIGAINSIKKSRVTAGNIKKIITAERKKEVKEIRKNSSTNTSMLLDKITKFEESFNKIFSKLKSQLVVVITLLAIVAIIFSILNIMKWEKKANENKNKKEERQSDADKKKSIASTVPSKKKTNPIEGKKILNENRFNSISKEDLFTEKGEVQIDFSLEGLGDFSISTLKKNDGRINGARISKNGTLVSYENEKYVKNSIRKSMNNYLYDSNLCSKETEKKILLLIRKKKIIRKI